MPPLKEVYRKLSIDELARLRDEGGLTPEASAALNAELKQRGLVKNHPPSPAGNLPTPVDSKTVTLTGIEIPFGNLVRFMVKLSLAAIPAGIILGVIYLAVITFGVGLFSSLR